MWTVRFWRDWPLSQRIFFFIFAGMLVAMTAAMWFGYFVQPQPAIELQTITEPELSEMVVDQVRQGAIELPVTGNNYIIFQRQLGGPIQPSIEVAIAYAALMAFFVVGMLAVISTLSKFYYLVGMGVFILFVTTLSPELLGVFGDFGKTFTVVILLLYGLSSFYLFYFKPTASFAVRILVFTGVTAVLGLTISFFNGSGMPFLYLATYATEAGLAIVALLTITVSHEILAGFLFVVTQGNTRTRTLRHFAIAAGIYLANLIIVYCIRFKYLNWDILTINLLLLLTISTVLGIWGIRQRQKTYEGIIDADPYAVYAYLIAAAFAFGTIAMLEFNGNDSPISGIEDIIIFSHLGFGFIFLMYLMSNFLSMMLKNYSVHKVLYAPTNMPFFTFRLGGVVATLSLLIYNTWQVPVHNMLAGYYNQLGDLYVEVNVPTVANAYYEEARTYGFMSHHANYALAYLEGKRLNSDGEQVRYEDASYLRPTPMSVLNWAQVYQASGKNVRAIIALREGMRKLTDKSSAENTLALLYARGGLRDSAQIYFERARKGKMRQLSNANLIGSNALGWTQAPVDSTIQDNHPGTEANRLALANKLGRVVTSFELPGDTVLTLAKAAAISNYLLNQRQHVDTAFVTKAVALARRDGNSGFKESILFSAALALYQSGEVKRAFQLMEEVTLQSDVKGKYNYIMTLWALDKREPKRALAYADYSISQGFRRAPIVHAVSLTEGLRIKESTLTSALKAWDSVAHGADTLAHQLAVDMARVLTSEPQALSSFTDTEKYSFARYRYTLGDSSKVFELVSSMTDDDIKARVLLDFAQDLVDADQLHAAHHMLERMTGFSLSDPNIGKQMALLEMITVAGINGPSRVVDAVKQLPFTFEGKDRRYKILFDAWTAEVAGDTTNATRLYEWLSTHDPFFDDGILSAARYFRGKGFVAYNLLSEAVLYHPSSIRIRKAYALESARRGFQTYSETMIEELKAVLGSKDWQRLKQEAESLYPKED